MYKKFYKLQTNPFQTNPDPRFLYLMPHTREALSGLGYGISERKGLMILTGEVGTGKTTILRRVLASFNPKRLHSAFIFNPSLEVLDFFEFVFHEFGLVPQARNKASMLIQLNEWLIERFRLHEVCVIVIDEAQNLSTALLEELRMLTNLETSSEKLLQIVLSGQPEFEAMLRLQSLRQVRQRISLWCRIYPLTLEQTDNYISFRLKVAGGSPDIFLNEAVNAIYRMSGGIPRLINVLCDHALIFGYVDQRERIPQSVIASVASDLRLDEIASIENSSFDAADILPGIDSAESSPTNHVPATASGIRGESGDE